MYYKIGLDIGITSVGWAAVELNTEDEPIRIIDLGVRIFDAAENPKDGASLALPRREARSARRRLRRHRHRLERIKYLLEQKNCLTREEIAAIYDSGQPLEDIYSIRVRALDEVLNKEDWVRLLIHLAQRRGFKSNRKSDTQADKEAGRLTQAVADNQALFAEKGYRTVGEMLYRDEKFREAKRNKKDSYLNTVDRAMLVAEIELLFAKQRQWGNPWADETLEAAYLAIFTSQRSFDQGPGGNSPYGGDLIAKMVGSCTFEPEEKRAAKATYTYEYFTLLQKLNHLRVGSTGSWRRLTDQERFHLVDLAKSKANLTYASLRKALKLLASEYFSDLSYGAKPVDEVEKKAKFPAFTAYHTLRKALSVRGEHRIDAYTVEQLNAVAYGLTVYKSDDKLREYFAENNIPEEDQDALLAVPSFSKFGHLSIKACEKILPHLELGLNYNDACTQAGYDFQGHASGEKSKFLPAVVPEFEDITNPVVRRAVAQTIKVINALIQRYGDSPAYVSIELAREMAKDFQERKALEKEMAGNQAENERIKERIRTEFGKTNPTGLDIVKYKLWQEQDGHCAYSLKPLEIQRLFDTGYAEIDHIIPYSQSFDDRYTNKVLVLTAENQHKGNRLPMVYLTAQGRQEDFIVWVKQQIKNKRKQEALLKTEITPEEEAAFKERNLNDTKYISRLLYNYLKDHLLLTPNLTGRKKTIMAVNGAVTAYMRKRWGLTKLREDGDLHHALDAVVIACVTDGMIKRVSDYSKGYKDRYAAEGEAVIDRLTGEVVHRFPLPWPEFRQELDMRLSRDPEALRAQLYLPSYAEVEELEPVFVSRMPKRKVKGAGHMETIRSPRELEEGYVISKKPLTVLKLDKDGEIDGYYKPSSDRLLYEALRKQLQLYGGKGDKAFAEPFYKPTTSGKPGPLVRSVKIREKATLTVPVHQGRGAAANGDMIRIDVFWVAGEGCYFVPIYAADTVRAELPNKAVVAFKAYDDWKEMRDEDFIFSLYPNDLLKVTAKKPMTWTVCNEKSSLPKTRQENECFCYYVSAGISVATLTVINHDKTYSIKSMGIKTLLKLEKYQVDVLGRRHLVKHEKRQGFQAMKRDPHQP